MRRFVKLAFRVRLSSRSVIVRLGLSRYLVTFIRSSRWRGCRRRPWLALVRARLIVRRNIVGLRVLSIWRIRIGVRVVWKILIRRNTGMSGRSRLIRLRIRRLVIRAVGKGAVVRRTKWLVRILLILSFRTLMLVACW